MADLSIRQLEPGLLGVILASEAPVVGVQAFLWVPGAILYDIRPGKVLKDVVLEAYTVVSFAGWASGNFPEPYGSGFPSGEFVLFTCRYRANGVSVKADFRRDGGRKFRTIVADAEGNDVTGEMVGAELEAA